MKVKKNETIEKSSNFSRDRLCLPGIDDPGMA